MKAFSRAVDRFCQKHRGFGVPRLMLYLVIISAIAFILNNPENNSLRNLLSFSPVLILSGEVWRLVTWIFIPVQGNILWVAVALYFYYFVGSTLEREWGAGRFTIYYIFGILLNIVYGFVMWFAFRIPMFLTPIYLNLSMFFAFATLFPEVQIRLLFIIPIKVKWMGLVNAGFFLISIVQGLLTPVIPAQRIALALLPVVAILNFFLMCGEELLAHIRPLKMRRSPQVVNFKKASRQVKRDMADKPYRHKCAVCGKTDTEYPGLEFRYCSKCEGYHCFCIDHINNHIHFEE